MNRFLRAAGWLSRFDESESQDQPRTGAAHLIVFCAAVTAAAAFSVARGQDVNWDILNYHFYNGFAFLHKPFHYDFAPAQVQSFFNPIIQVFSYLALAHLPAMAVAALWGAVQGINFYLIFRISEVLFRGWRNPLRFVVSLCTAAAGFYGAINILELGTTFGDNLDSIFILAGLLLIFRHLLEQRTSVPVSIIRPGIAGACLGIAFGIKLTAAIYVAGIAIPFTFLAFSAHRRVRPLAAFYGGLAAGFLAAYGFWGISLYLEYRNPFYPYLNAFFQSPYYDLQNTADARFFPQTWQQKLFFPFFFMKKSHLASELDFRDARLAFCYVAVVFLAIAALWQRARRALHASSGTGERQDPTGLTFLALFFVISYAAWQVQFSIYRYLIILEFLAPVFLTLLLARFFRRKSLVFVLALAASAIICASVIPADFGRQKYNDAFLKVEIPEMEGLDKSVVLMAGEEATSYIIPRFPPATRFLRINSNFFFPGRNTNLDNKIRKILAQYESGRILVYLANQQEKEPVRRAISFYGIGLEDRSCREVRSLFGESGYLCGTAGEIRTPPPNPLPVTLKEPEFEESAQAHMEVTPKTATEGVMIQFRLVGLKLRTIDVLYSINGELMPPLRYWNLDENQVARYPVSASTRRGLYHIIGVRDSSAPKPERWMRVDSRILIR
jgi:hypothetical protein